MSLQHSFIPYGKQHLDKADIGAVIACLTSDFLTQGPRVETFEKALAKKTGANYAIAVANGTAALHLVTLALGLEAHSEIITTPISFLATSNCLLYANLKPVFADVDPVSGNLSVEAVQNKITKKTKAIYLTHLAGNPCDLKIFSVLAKKHKLLLIEDCAHALGARYENKLIGDCRYSDAAILSFHPVKHITTGEGGAVLTNDKSLAEKIIRLRSHGVTRDPRLLQKNPGPWYYEMQELGFNYRLTDMQAALGISQLSKLERFINARRAIASHYRKYFKADTAIGLPEESHGSRHAYHLFPIRLLSRTLMNCRKQIFDDLFQAGIGVQVHYIPIPSQPFYQSLGYSMKGLEGAQRYYESVISLPIYPGLTKKQAHYVISTFKKIISHYVNRSKDEKK